jgi:hypothetical protein
MAAMIQMGKKQVLRPETQFHSPKPLRRFSRLRCLEDDND